jgi:predicted ATP-dependent protease
MRERVHEAIRRGTVLIDTTGEKVGQVNGLWVLALGDFSFGQPSRITATARVGRGQVVDIEREVKLGSAYHSKGVLILSSFFAQRYARDRSLALNATLVFEQSYGQVDGDSASVAELCALLSALAGLPIRQSIAVTGSVNQHGAVQAIGGVNEKIEGFYDICSARGLSGDQGVVIPASNEKHLMLRSDVAAAVEAGRFHVWSVDFIDEAVELLIGIPAGEPDEKGEYPVDTVNRKVSDELARLAKLQKELVGDVAKKSGEAAVGEPAADAGKAD